MGEKNAPNLKQKTSKSQRPMKTDTTYYRTTWFFFDNNGAVDAIFPTCSQVGQCIETEMCAGHFTPGYLNYFHGYIFPSTDT